MNLTEKITLSAEVEINGPIENIWQLWTMPEDIVHWNTPNAEWHTTAAENDIRTGGKFLFVMALTNGSFSFDYTGTYDRVNPHELIAYTLNDGRKTMVTFTQGHSVKILETFEADNSQPIGMQKEFCQAVLDNFKRYVEGKK